LVALLGVFNLLLTPVYVSVLNVQPEHIIVVCYSIVILTGSVLAKKKIGKTVTYAFGALTLISIWLELVHSESPNITIYRLSSSFILFSIFCFNLFKQMMKTKKINIRFILGPLLGFLYLGVLGGILFETINFYDPRAFRLIEGFSGFSFYYFSFISITTVGYGDITPLSPPAQSITLVMNIIGQFYLAIVIGVFVGKYINVKSN